MAVCTLAANLLSWFALFLLADLFVCFIFKRGVVFWILPTQADVA